MHYNVTYSTPDGKTVTKPLLRGKPKQNSILYIGGATSSLLKLLVDFMYFGEASVQQSELDKFLALAEEFKISGLSNQLNSSEKATEKKSVNHEPNIKKYQFNHMTFCVSRMGERKLAKFTKPQVHEFT